MVVGGMKVEFGTERIFEPVQHSPPGPPSPYLGFGSDMDCADINGEKYLRLSACISVVNNKDSADSHIYNNLPSINEPEPDADEPNVDKDSAYDRCNSALTITATFFDQTSDCGEKRETENELIRSEATRNEAMSINLMENVDIANPTSTTEVPQMTDLLTVPDSPTISVSSVASSNSQFFGGPDLTDTSFNALRRESGDAEYDDDDQESPVAAHRLHPPNNLHPQMSTLKRVTSAPLLDQDPGGDEVDSPTSPRTVSDEWSQYEQHFSWYMKIPVDKGVKCEPQNRSPLKKSDFIVIGIRKHDALPEIWVMSTKPDLRLKEHYVPKMLGGSAHEPWRLERKGELKCEVKVSSGDTQYLDFLFTLASIGQAELLYAKMLEASSTILFLASMSCMSVDERKLKIEERRRKIEELMSENVSNLFCAECCCKFLGVFDLWFSLDSWTMVCTKCSNWQRRFISSARHLWLDEFNDNTWDAMQSASNAFMSRYWYSDTHPDHYLDGYELLREDPSPSLKECVAERHIYGKYCNMKFIHSQGTWKTSTRDSVARTSQSLYRLLLEEVKDMPQIIDHVFNGVHLNEVHRHEVKLRIGADKHHQEVMKFVDFIENTNSLLDKEAPDIMNPTTDCITSFFIQNPNVRGASFVYSADKTDKALVPQGVKLHKRGIFEVIPYPREKDDPNLPENTPKPEFYIPSELVIQFYDHFLKEVLRIKTDFSRSPEIINRPRIIGLTKFKCEEKVNSTFSKCCAILDNFILYIFPQITNSSEILEIDLRFVYNVTHLDAKKTQGDFFSFEHDIKIDYFKPHENTFPVLKLQFSDENEMLLWKKLLSDWINVTQSPLLHRQPMEKHFSGMFCNYAVAILIGEKLMTPIFTTKNKKQWLVSSIYKLPEQERNFVSDFSFKCDMPRQPSSIESYRQFSNLESPAAFLQLLIKFTKDHLMVPARFIHKIQSSQSNQSLVAAGLDSMTSTLSRNYSEVSRAVNGLSIAYKNTLMEIFWYFKVLVKNSDDLSVPDLVEWLAQTKFCNGLFSCETMTNMIDFFEDFFQVEENFAKQREKQFELIRIQLERIPNKTSTMQVLFIRNEWLKYKYANDSEYENLLEPIKLTNPPDFTKWTYGYLVEELYEGITKSSGKRLSKLPKVINGTETFSASASSNESLDDVIDSESHTYLLVERLTYNKHVIRILPYSCQIDPQILPMSVLMQCKDFLLAFQMLVLLQKKTGQRDTTFDVEYAKLKWDSDRKRPEEKRFTKEPMVLSVDVNCARLQKRSSSGSAATSSTNESTSSSSSSGVSLCLSHFDLYFGSVSSKPAKFKQLAMKDKKVDSEKWKRSLSLIGENHCHILTFDQPPVMLSGFWSLQHAKLGARGVEEWIPNHKMNNLKQQSRARPSNTTSGAERSSADSFASQGSIGVVSYINTNGRDSSADQLCATDDDEFPETTDGPSGRIPPPAGFSSRRNTGTLTGPSSSGTSSSSVKKGKGFGSSGLSRSMDMLQETLSALPINLPTSSTAATNSASNKEQKDSSLYSSGMIEKESRGTMPRISIIQRSGKALKKKAQKKK